MNLPINKIATIFGILVTISGFGSWVYAKYSDLATKHEVHLQNLDTRISDVETVVLIYTLIGEDKLDPVSKERYERAKARLVNLETERDKNYGLAID